METRSLSLINLTISQSLDYIFALSYATTYDFHPCQDFNEEYNLPVFPDNINYFNELAYLGSQLRAVLKSRYDEHQRGLYPLRGKGDNIVREISFDDSKNRYYINKDRYFENVTTELYNSRSWGIDGQIEFPVKVFFDHMVGHAVTNYIYKFESELLMHRNMQKYILQIDDVIHSYFREAYPVSVSDDDFIV